MTAQVCLSLFRFQGFQNKLWAFSMMGRARRYFQNITHLKFWKLCGSGTGEGFTPQPNWAVYAVLTAWDDKISAKDQLHQQPIFKLYTDKAEEHWHIWLQPQSSRGQWDGQQPFIPTAEKTCDQAPLAVLTRASLRPRFARQFWQQVPNISKRIGQNTDVLFKIGIGEIPLFHQITFSIWPDAHSMSQFAHQGPHACAIKAVRQGDWFREDLYARFRVVETQGSWREGFAMSSQQENY